MTTYDESAPSPARSSGMQSTFKVLKVLEAVAEHQPVGVGELSRSLQMPKSTVQRCLITLHEAGWLRQARRGSGEWSLTAHALSIGRRVEPDLLSAAQIPLRALGSEVDESVYLAVRDGVMAVVVDRVESQQVLRASRPIGARTPIFATAAGRAILSRLPDEEIKKVLSGDLPKLTESTVVDRGQLMELIHRARLQGFAVNQRQNDEGVCAVSAPVLDQNGEALAAITISFPASRFDEEKVEHWGRRAARAGLEISRAMGIEINVDIDEPVPA